MFQLGKKQLLVVEKPVPMGVYLKEQGADEKDGHVLLPRNQVPADTEVGTVLEVFLYKDSEDRIIATRKQPKLCLHQVGYLQVKDVGKVGAFMDWGLDKDLLLPFHEQPKKRVQKGQECLVAVYLDKSERLCATMNVYPYLRTDSPYRTGDEVYGTVYQTSDNFGIFVAVDDIYSALIPKKELVRDLEIGQKIHARVTQIKPDGKLDLSIRDKAPVQIEKDAKILLDMLTGADGRLPISDRTDPEVIRDTVHMSKNEFKRAAGHLLKEGKIEIGADEIRLRQPENKTV